MLPKQHRLSLRKEFNRVKKQGQVFPGRFFSLLVAEQTSLKTLFLKRFAFIVSKKIAKNATRRNKIRRLLAEAVYTFLPKIKTGFDGVFLTKKTIVDKSFSQIKKEVEEVFKQADLLK